MPHLIPHLSSRERMLAALCGHPVDHVPCSFMLYNGLKSTCRSYEEFILRQIELGLDACVQLPARPPVVANDYYNLHGLPVRHDPAVAIMEWREEPAAGELPILVKEYRTPAGTLRAEVRRTDDWRWGDHVPFLDDYITSRARRFPVNGPDDLPALRYLLAAPDAADIAAFAAEADGLLTLARQHDLLVTGGWGVGADLIGWVYGLERMVYLTYDQPDFLAELLDIIATWNRARMRVVLSAGIDLYIKRAWYENTDFWSPASWRRYIQPILAEDVRLAHEHCARFGYIITSKTMPLLDLIADTGVDVVIGVDPREWDLARTQQTIGDRVCLWGGVNGHLTVEQGSEEDVRAEVRRALATLGRGSRFILSPVDNVRTDSPEIRRNVAALIDEWQRAR